MVDLDKVWNILVEHCGAREDGREFFLASCKGENSRDMGMEYRFQGILGMGGKVWINQGDAGPYVNYYQEDCSPTREEAVRATNEALENVLVF